MFVRTSSKDISNWIHLYRQAEKIASLESQRILHTVFTWLNAAPRIAACEQLTHSPSLASYGNKRYNLRVEYIFGSHSTLLCASTHSALMLKWSHP